MILTLLLAAFLLPIQTQTAPATQDAPPSGQASGTAVAGANPSQPAAAAQPEFLNQPTPADPRERMVVGAQRNGLMGGDMKPWHLKADYETFDADGKSDDKGTFEMWWMSATRYKLEYKGAKFNQQEYGTEHGILHTGDAGWPTRPLRFVRPLLLEPVPALDKFNKLEPVGMTRKFGGTQLSCTGFTLASAKPDQNSSSYCFADKGSILRYANSADRMEQSIFDKVIRFRDRVMGSEIQQYTDGKKSLAIQVDTIQSLHPSEEAQISVPDGAAPVTERLARMPGSGPLVLKKVFPKYPELAKERRIQGIVLISAVIGTDGHVSDVQAVAGPPMLRQAAMDTVRDWVYEPPRVDGRPVEVDSEFNIIFRLGN